MTSHPLLTIGTPFLHPIMHINIEPALRMAQIVFQHPVAVQAIMRDHRWCGKYTMYDDTPREVMIDIDTI